jgi:type VI secretion system Hcp family effector
MNGEISTKHAFALSARHLGAVVSLAFALAVPATARADLITLSLPGITGDVTAKGLEGAIEVLSLTGNVQAPANGLFSARGRANLPVFTDLMIQKRLDSSSPALFLALVKNTLFNSAVITFLHSSEAGFTKFFTITLENALITRFATNDSETDVFVGHEQINLNYVRIRLKDEVTGQTACYDLNSQHTCG